MNWATAIAPRESLSFLARIAPHLRQTQWRVALVTLVERAGVENASRLPPPRCRVALLGQDRSHLPTPRGRIVSARASGHLGHSCRVARAASNRNERKNEGLPHRLLHDSPEFSPLGAH